MRILLTNDDSVHAEGILVLKKYLDRIADVTVVAPMEEKSTTGHSLTLHKPLRLMNLSKNVYGVNGSPADCVLLGMSKVMKQKPDLVVSGINRGANLGQDVYYSGTVSAAREATMHQIPSIAVSLFLDFKKRKLESALNYESAAHYCVKLIKKVTGPKALRMPLHTLFNLNVPDLPLKKIKGMELGRQGFRKYSQDILQRVDHRGRDYYWVGGGYVGYYKEAGTDCSLVDEGFACLTPLRLDCTDHEYLVELSERFGGVK